MGTVPQNMSKTKDKPGATRLLSRLLPSVMLLASSSVTETEHDPGDAVNMTIEKIGNTEMDRETIDSLWKSLEKILATDNSNILTTSTQSSENEDHKNVEAQPSYLAFSILLCFLLFPSLSENMKYQASIDCYESCHLQTSAMSKFFPDNIQTFEI